SVVVVLATILCLTLVGCSKNSPDNPTLDNKQPNSGFVVAEQNFNGISLQKSALMAADYSTYGVSALAESAYNISATLQPADAVDQQISWHMEWLNPTSTWATGKDVSAYISLVVDTGSKNATVSCLAPFGNQIIVKAVANYDTNIFATCTLDYSQKVSIAELNFGDIKINLGGETEIQYEVAKTITGSGGTVTAKVATTEVYSLAENYVQSVKLVPITIDGVNKFFSCDGSAITGLSYDVSANYIGAEIYYDYPHEINKWFILKRNGDILFKNLSTQQIAGYLSKVTQPYLYDVELTLTGTHNTYTYTSRVKCVGYTNKTPVQSVSLNNAGFVF
ncbi:MAG: hypothetical protein RSC44_05525, partial [Clostridia bacterium]